jgi:hypothetical protein
LNLEGADGAVLNRVFLATLYTVKYFSYIKGPDIRDYIDLAFRLEHIIETKTITARLLDKETSDAVQPYIYYNFHHEIYRNRKKYLRNL